MLKEEMNMSQKTYEVTLAIYVNCHISGTKHIEFQANDMAEAEAIAKQRANDIEKDLSKKHPDDDIWVDVEGICE